MNAKLALVFAGQGSQAVGMGRALVETYPVCARLFERASETLGYDMAKLCFEGPIDVLTRTDRCQPAIFTVSAACVAALRLEYPGLAPDAVAGLSLGEWTALFDARVIGFEDTLRVLQLRGRAMQEACDERPGTMVSVLGMSAGDLEPLAEQAGVHIANINAPDQVVLSGAREAVTAAAAAAQAAGARKTIPLKVAGAYHSTLMASAAGRLERMLEDIPLQAPAVPVLSNVTGKPHGTPDDIKPAMVAQVVSTVRWADNVRWLLDRGVTTFVECGPGSVLGNLIKRLDKRVKVTSIQDVDSLKKTVAWLTGASVA